MLAPAPRGAPLLALRSVTRVFERRGMRRAALDNVSLEVRPGEILGLIGPNGAGKTTLLRVASGDLRPDAGIVEAQGERARSDTLAAAVTLVPEPPVMPGQLTGTEWLRYLAVHRSAGPAAALARQQHALGVGTVAAFARRRIQAYSRGMAQQLALAGALVLAGQVLLLDETLSGLDPVVARDIRRQIALWVESGGAAVIASHDLNAVERLANRVVVMHHGRVAAERSMAEMLGQRVLEIGVNGGSLRTVRALLDRFPGSSQTGDGVAIPLKGDLTIESVLDVCRGYRVAVTGSRVRYRGLEDLLVDVVEGRE